MLALQVDRRCRIEQVGPFTLRRSPQVMRQAPPERRALRELVVTDHPSPLFAVRQDQVDVGETRRKVTLL